jgi:hypothetical protein
MRPPDLVGAACFVDVAAEHEVGLLPLDNLRIKALPG